MVKMLKWQKDGMGFEVLCTLRYHHMGSFKTPWCTQCLADLTQSLFLTLEVQLLFFKARIYCVAALEYVLDFHSWCFCFLLHLKFCYVMCNRWPPYAPFVTCKWEEGVGEDWEFFGYWWYWRGLVWRWEIMRPTMGQSYDKINNMFSLMKWKRWFV